MLIVLVVVSGLVLAWVRVRSAGRPMRSGAHTLAGLEAAVRVRFDSWGVPHIEAESEDDAMAALGFVHANDRMTQMELGRRAAFGRLAELFGNPAVEVDVHFRTLRIGVTAEAMAEAVSPRTRRWLAAYARGVNAWLAARGEDLPPGLRLLGLRPEPWRPADSIAFALLMARDLSFWNGRPEEQRFRWLRAFGEARSRELIGAPDLHLPAAIQALAARMPPTTGMKARNGEGGVATAAPGSNNWALGPGRTRNGAALLANDPHLELNLPSIWYQALIRAPGYEAAGMTLPGAPGVVIGRGPHLAWAFTNTMLDDHDLFFEELDETGEHYRRGDGWQPLIIERQTITVRQGDDRDLVLRATDRGPLLDADPKAGLPARSLAWTAHEGGDPLAALADLAAARHPEEALAALDPFICPAQNLVVAFRDGTLLFTVLGRVPARRQGDGRLPAPGADVAYGWEGLRPRAENPLVVLSPEDAGDALLVTANNDIRPPDYTLPLVADFFPGHRAHRIRERLQARSDWDVEGSAALATEPVSLYARDVVAHLGTPDGGDAARAYQALAGWDHAMELHGPAALYALVERELMRAIFADEAADAELGSIADQAALLRLLEGEMDSAWFDDVSTSQRESRAATIDAALAAAWQEGVRRWGEDVAAWDYGALHQLTLRHRLDAVPVLGGWLRRGPFPVAGSGTAIAAYGAVWRGDRQMVTFGPSMRWVVDWGQPDRAFAALPGGQSGHGADPHYDDQIAPFLAGSLHVAPWSEAMIAGAAVAEMRLLP